MIPPMNGMTVYALGFELDRALAGAAIKTVSQFTGGCTVTLKRAPFPYLHVLLSGAGAELVIAKKAIVRGENLMESMRPIHGATIRGSRSLGMDRILLLGIEAAGSWGEKTIYTVRLDMTPAAKAVTLFHEGTDQPVESFGSRRARMPSRPDELPPAKQFSILDLPGDTPKELLEAPVTHGMPETVSERTRAWEKVKSAALLLARHIGGLDPVLAHVLSKNESGDMKRIWPCLVEIGRALEEKRWSWHVYDFPEGGSAGRSALYPIRLPVPAKGVACETFFEAVHRKARETIMPRYIDFLIMKASSRARIELQKAERLMHNITNDIDEAERYKELRHYGNLLVTYRHNLKAGLENISVRDFDGERKVTIPLDPRLSPDENIRMYFRRAKKGEKGILIMRNRRRAVSNEIGGKRKFIESISKLTDPNEIITLISGAHGPVRARRRERRPPRFRTYSLDERHTVYVGRNNAENDYLTHRFAAPRDIWLHAQGVTGSHVILKGATRSTPKKILETAAAIAAYFSKARHSATVPVIYTEKRYVRKPRKSTPGTAVHERGKTLFVEPSLPDDKDRSNST